MPISNVQNRGLTDVTNVGVANNVKAFAKPQPRNSGIRRRRSETDDASVSRQAPNVRNSLIAQLLPVDVKNMDDELYVSVYASGIFKDMHEKENKYPLDPDYMTRQVDITDRMRAILMDWLVDVHMKFKVKLTTLFLTQNLIDRYLDQYAVARDKLQLVGVTAMLVASKYEEIYPPEINDFILITDRAYTRDEILDMEILMLNRLSFHITVPTSFMFLNRYLAVDDAEEKSLRSDIAHFILQLTLPEYSTLKYSPSRIAASTLYLTNRLFEVTSLSASSSWGPVMSEYTGFSDNDIRGCTKELLQFLCNLETSGNQAVRRKYNKFKNGEILRSAPIQKVLQSQQPQ